MSTVLARPTPLMERLDLLTEARLGVVAADRLTRIWDPLTCPTALLPWVAASLGALVWPSQAPVEARRAWLAEAGQLAARAGTAWAVRRALELCGLPLTAVQRTGPKTYRVVLSQAPTGGQMALIRALCDAYAPLTARLVAVDVELWDDVIDGNLADGILDGNVASTWVADGSVTGPVELPPDGGGLDDLGPVEVGVEAAGDPDPID